MDEAVFSAGDVKKAAGLSSRQMNDWDQRGALPHSREGDSGWRRFTLREMFALVVCAEMRRQLGIPVEKLKFVMDLMMEAQANHLSEAAISIIHYGVDVWILTDFAGTFEMYSDVELEQRFFDGSLGGEGLVMLKVNRLVTGLLGSGDNAVELSRHGKGYEFMRDLRRESGIRSGTELHILNLIRSGDYSTIEIVLKDGKVKTIRKSKRVNQTTRIVDLIKSNDYQQIRIAVQNGKVVSLEQASTERAE